MSQRVRTAVILAAGMGVRLQNRGRFVPKGFLLVGERPIVEESILNLKIAGIERVIIVTGHCSEHYEDLARRYPDLIELVHNDEYATSGSMYSLYCARERIQEDFLLLESDLVYQRRALEFLRDFDGRDAILVSGLTNAGDEIYIETRDGNLVDMSKQRDTLGPEIAGELVGINKVSMDLLARMIAISAVAFERSLKFDYETDCFVQVAQGHPIPCPVLADLVWGEIDYEEHLERARSVVYPVVRDEWEGVPNPK